MTPRPMLWRFLASCLALLAPTLAQAGPAILLYPALGQPREVVVSGRVLAQAPSAGSSSLSRNLRRLLAPNWEGVKVEVAFEGEKKSVTSGQDGDFEVRFVAAQGSSFPVGLQQVEARVPGASAVSRVEVVPEAAPFIVISDFDDTLALTHVTQTKRLLESALLKDSDTQEVAPGMAAFLGCLRQGKPAPPGFALVSGSPVQYVPRTARFLARHGFPFFGMYLRDLGPDTLKGYKQPVLRKLLAGMPQRVVLIGDSGEHDPEVYAEIRKEAPERVARIYIRDAGRSGDPARFEGMVIFGQARTAADDAVAQGLMSAQCRDQAFGAAQ